MAGTAKRFETRSSCAALVSASGGTRGWTSVDADKRRVLPIGRNGGRETPDPPSLFRRGFQEQGICGFGVSVRPFVHRGSSRPRLLGLAWERSPFVTVGIYSSRFGGIFLSSSKKKPTCHGVPDDILPPFATFSIAENFEFPIRSLANWPLHTQCHSSIPKMYCRYFGRK